VYSRRGYAVAAAIIEKAAGKSFEEFMRSEVFAPAGMARTGFTDGEGLRAEDAALRVSMGRFAEPGRMNLFVARRNWLDRGHTGVVTCLKDLEAWERVLSSDVLLTDNSREQLITIGLENYALGSYLTTTPRDTRRMWHGGSSPGQIAISFRYIDEGVSMYIISNENGEPDHLLNMLTDELLPALPETFAGWVSLFPDAQRPEVLELPGPVTWKARRSGEEIVLTGATATHPCFAELRLSEGLARRIMATIKNVRRGSVENVAGESVRIDPGRIGIGKGGRVPLSAEARIEFRGVLEGTGADGAPFRERRPILAVIDPKAQGWPLLVRMDDAHAGALYDTLAGAVRETAE
jgi:hypothetical protein